ncbi:hypothetical protein [Streptomyces lancefieldiae]|uniref:Uncharacterized protein n=1 Tax=Streptomyces lancefieldiae TaxID=3075520 RepID=A0ABU3AF26_9ACTN|nr:hypothetical protein [Streptomyces sp. DSM 40712]MDT0608782.1 hypothetical protein [Streptomyces sp. DSM 40712]
MTAPVPSRLSPTAGLLNALARLYIRRAVPFIAIQEKAREEAINLNHRLRTARDFADTEAAGYIDRSYLEEP